MRLYEIITNMHGCSYVRCYAWCESTDRAMELFKQQHPAKEIKSVRRLFSGDDGEFITETDDEGFSTVKLPGNRP